MSTLVGNRAVVTGAAVGIGSAAAQVLARRGAEVLAVDHHDAVTTIGRPPSDDGRGRIDTAIVDLNDVAALNALASRLRASPPTAILVNCAAAYPPDGGVLAADIADWDRVLRVNVAAMGVLSRALAEGLRGTGQGGAIVNVGSVQETLPVPGFGPYVTSKGAVTAGTGALAVELAEHGIRVNAVTPGVVATPSTTTDSGEQPWAQGGSEPPTLLGRAGTPEEVAEVVAFLASEAASFITGAVVPVDGGRRLSRRPDPQGERRAEQ